MIGAIAGDIVGSVYEWNNYKAKGFQPLFRYDCFYTDDTICTIAVADALLNHKNPAVCLKEWGLRYFDNDGWGSAFRRWLQSPDAGPYNSWGNGAAMRVSAAGWLATSLEHALELATQVTEVTHNHPEGIRGAAATTMAIYLARQRQDALTIRKSVAERFGYDLSLTVDQIRPEYKFNESCQGTVPQALVCALEATGFEDAIRNAISIGGDSDTVAAIAGPVAEAMFGIPVWIVREVYGRLPKDMHEVLNDLYR
jgi:ADP-ribosyl-[dinitrogen reductase] hydrolase